MMFTCAAPVCTDPVYGHRPALDLRKGTATAVRAPRSSPSAKVVRSRKGKSLRVDIHCHYLNPEVQARTAPENPAQYDPSRVYANELTREVN